VDARPGPRARVARRAAERFPRRAVDTDPRLRYFNPQMNTFPLPAEPTEKETALEDTIIRWVTVSLPFLIIGKILGLLAIAAILISFNFNVIGWIE
jgi:hypothetical protein